MAKQYDNDFKLNTVKLVVEEGKPASQVARDLGITPNTLYRWISQYKDDPKHPFVGSVRIPVNSGSPAILLSEAILLVPELV
ncbi:transposase [Alicyclobacillus curvatus]|nr:transposase [Alicyclobacillus curvatus]